jgi:adenylate cyclase
MKQPGRGSYIFLVCGVIAAAVAIRALDPFFVKALRLIPFDVYQRVAPQHFDRSLPVRIVDIDEASIARLGQWPWPRTVMADLVTRLAGQGASAIAFDVMFPETDRTSLEEVAKRLPPEQAARLRDSASGLPSNDEIFAAALAKTPSVIGLTLTSGNNAADYKPKAGFAVAGDDPRPFIAGFSGATGNLPILTEAAKGLGALNWTPDRDQILRRVSLIYRLGDKYVPSLAAEALRIAQGASTYVLKSSNASGETAFGKTTGLNHVRIGDIHVPTDAQGAIWMKFRASDPESFIPVWKVLAGEVPDDEISGRIILIGTSAPGLLDLRATPVDPVLPGVEVISMMIEHIVSGQSLTRPDYAPAAEQLVIVLLGAMLAFVFSKVSARSAGLIGLVIIMGLLFSGWLAYRYADILLDPLYPALALMVLMGAATFHIYRRVELQRSEIRGAFGRYVAPSVVERLIANPERLELGGEVREISLMFCDVRNFTSISETMSASELTTFINELLTPLSETILDYRGTIDKYIGDSIMAFWNAPLDEPEHARLAVEAALGMAARIPELNRYWQESAEAAGQTFAPVKIGIGINTGNCCVGNLGSTQRFDYSAIGDEVNLAARLEGLSKLYGVTVIMSERTVERLKDIRVLELDVVRVKGRAMPTRIYTPLALAGGDRAEELAALQAEFLAAYRAQNWDSAKSVMERTRAFLAALGTTELDSYYALFASRIAAYRADPPPADWDGAYTALEK